MDSSLLTGVIVGAAIALVGFLITYFSGKKLAAAALTDAESKAKAIVNDAEHKAEGIKKTKIDEAEDKFREMKRKFESERDSKEAKVKNLEKELRKREEGIDQKLEVITKKEKQVATLETDLQGKVKQIETKSKQVDELLDEQTIRLERITGMSREDAKKFLIDNMINEAKADAAQMVKDVRDEAKLNARKEAQRIVLMAIQRTASDHCVESTVSVVNLQSEEMKGRIIGREGRNIRAFEAATGIDLIIDDTPEAVVISGFDPFRREVARTTL
jgi:ribonuclease Y